MIPIGLAREPADFDEKVRRPGLAAIEELVGRLPGIKRRGPRRAKVADIESKIPADRFPPLWRKALDDMMEASIVNSKKGELQNLVDPINAKTGWFELDLKTFRVLRGTSAPEAQHSKIDATLQLLNIRDCCRQREQYVEDYQRGPGAGGIDWPYLEHRAPFIALELRRQGQLVRGDV